MKIFDDSSYTSIEFSSISWLKIFAAGKVIFNCSLSILILACFKSIPALIDPSYVIIKVFCVKGIFQPLKDNLLENFPTLL